MVLFKLHHISMIVIYDFLYKMIFLVKYVMA